MSYSGRENKKELTAQKPEKYSVIIWRKNGVRHYPSISRTDYQAPMFQLITIRQESGIYKFIRRKLLGGYPLGYVEKGKYITEKKFSALQIGVILYRRKLQLRALLSIRRSFLTTPDRYTTLRKKYSLREDPMITYFWSLADDMNTFWIDSYLSENPDLQNDVMGLCKKLGLNPNYSEDQFLVASYLMFGDMVIDKTSELYSYMGNKISKILKIIKTNNSITNLSDFEIDLLDLVQKEIIKDKNGFMERVKKLDKYYETSRLTFDIFANTYIIELINENNVLVKRFLEIEQGLTRDEFYEIIGIINNKTSDYDPIDVNSASRGSLDELFGKADPDLNALLGGRLFFQIPVNRIKVEEFRKYFPKMHEFRESRLGKRNPLRPNKYDERQLQRLIKLYGLFGFPKSKASEILGKEKSNVEVEDGALYQLKLRANRKGEFVEFIKLFT